MAYRLSVGVLLLTLFIVWLELSWFAGLLLTLAIYLLSGGWRFAKVFCLTFKRDFRALSIFIRYKLFLKKVGRESLTVSDVFQNTVQKYEDKVAFMFEDKQWKFKDVELFTNKIANYFQSTGYKKGDVVALFMENRPELVFFWLGLSKIGVVSALINYNLRKESLIHCISTAKSKGLIYSSDSSISDAVYDIHSSLENVELFQFGCKESSGLNTQNIQEKLNECSDKSPPEVYDKNADDVLFYIYTSGTTGLPKASVIRHVRFFALSVGWSMGNNICADDVIYCTLPLYHATAGVVGVGTALSCGATLVVRRKFSASRFWEECSHYKATVALYIGELCRYLLAQPPKESDKSHCLRFISGNGLRPQICDKFKTRFNIPLIVEFYGATEGNVSLMNFEGHSGACGFLPVTFAQALPIRLLKMDPSGEQLLRGSDGFCIACQPGEVGQIAGKIIQKEGSRRFDGYLNEKATSKKIIHDVFKKGDKWFLSGDTLFWDEMGYVYFHDRLGDTFRWRGENVSTGEVEGGIIKILGTSSVVVYGVEIPGCEGRAGMAAIEDPDDVISIELLGTRLPEVLPSYARPVILRITNAVETTATFKFQKARFRKEGFDLSLVKDKLFYLDQKSGEYRVLTHDIYRKFQNGEMRF